ncbi:uncharacterized protein [Asterias amurensis]|uniref:uncharacterized protein n=1 Tax=Asterias amurensis TaxID=7602 RepID=UPI003AB757D3
MITVLKAIETLTSVNYRELYRAWEVYPPVRLVEDTNNNPPPLMPKWHIPDAPGRFPTTRILYRLRRSAEQEDRVLRMKKMRQQIYQDAYCSQVHLDHINLDLEIDINPDIEIATSTTKDEDEQSTSGVSSTSSSQEGLGITGEDEDVARPPSSQDANAIPSDEGRDDETVNDVSELVQEIDDQTLRLRRSAEHEDRVLRMEKMRQQIYQDAYCSQVHLENLNLDLEIDINPDIEIATSSTKDEDEQSSSGVSSTSSSQGGLDITGEDEDVARPPSSQDANAIPSDERRDDETVNDVSELFQMINDQQISESETLQALKDAEQKTTSEAPKRPKTPPSGSCNAPSSSRNGAQQECSGLVFLEGSVNVPSTSAENKSVKVISTSAENKSVNVISTSAETKSVKVISTSAENKSVKVISTSAENKSVNVISTSAENKRVNVPSTNAEKNSVNVPSTSETKRTSPASNRDENAASATTLADPSGSLSPGDEVNQSKPQSEGDGSTHAQQSVQKGRTFEGVMERVDAMMAQPLDIGGETGSMLPWLQAMGYEEDNSTRPRQPSPRQSMEQPNMPPILPPTAATSAAPPLMVPAMAGETSIPAACQTPTGHRASNPECQLQLPTHPAAPLRPAPLRARIRKRPPKPAANISPKVINKRRLVHETQTLPEIDFKAQRKGPSHPVETHPEVTLAEEIDPFLAQEIDQFFFTAVPLPAVCSFIPVLHEIELEDVMTQGKPTCLGKGVNGEVFLKKKISDGTLVAVKKILATGTVKYNDMVNEIRVMLAVQHCKEIPKVWGIIDHESFALEFVGDPVTKKSSNLHSFLSETPANLETSDWIQICLDISRGVLALHEAGWSHNDLHVGNIVVWYDSNNSNKCTAKVVDLGIADRIDSPSPEFMWTSARKAWCYKNCPHIPPEVIEGVCKRGIKSDVFSLGHLFLLVSYKNIEKLSFFRDLCEKCQRRMPHDRPTVDVVVKEIEEFKCRIMNKKMGPRRGRVTRFT